MPANKRAAQDDPSALPNGTRKRARQDGAAADYSLDVRKKLQMSNRTGQACDRCRMRKMRCDGLPNGCGPCVQNQTPCRTTDRMTGIANERGHVPKLERRIRELESHIRGQEGQLTSLGADVKPFNPESHPNITPLLQWNRTQEQKEQDEEADGSVPSPNGDGVTYTPSQNGKSTSPSTDGKNPLPEFRDGLAGDNYLGVSSGNSFISSIRGTAMNVLGAEIDLADYMSPDMDEPDSTNFGTEYPLNKSYRAFVQTAYNSGPKPAKVQLPPEKDGRTYAEWYFRLINPYLPMLHRPSFMELLDKFYTEKTFEPSTAETVMVHMMFAVMYFQSAMRNAESPSHSSGLNDLSNCHYHYALSFFPRLMASHTLQDVQALTMISLHLRSFPKPGACWMLSATTLNLAIELGLHRSAKQWAPITPKRSVLEIEMRKRIFWSIFTIHTIVGGKLGRPMALRREEYDVEIPQAVDDELLTADGIDDSRTGKCGFLVGIESFKSTTLFTDLYSNIYTVRRSPSTYIDTVRRIEKRIQDWYEQWPQELKLGDASKDEQGRVHAQYMHVSNLELRLLLRHPSISLTTSTDFNEENLTKSMEASRSMLKHVKVIQRYKSLDTNWQTGALYVLAISTTLFGHWQRVEQMAEGDLAVLKQDMDDWLSIVGDIGGLLGSGKRLQDAVRVTVDRTLTSVEQRLKAKTLTVASQPKRKKQRTTAPAAASGSSQVKYEQYNPKNGHEPYNNATTGIVNGASEPSRVSSTGDSSTATQHETPYAPTAPYPFLGPSNTYPNGQSPYAPTAYTGNETASSLPPQATATAATAYLYNTPPTSTDPVYQSAMPMNYGAGPQLSWRNWAGSMAGNMPNNASPQEYINSASALMQLGNDQNTARGVPPATDLQIGASLEAAQQWPMMIFDGGQPGI